MADIHTGQPDLGKVKTAIHRRLIQKLNLDRVAQLNREPCAPKWPRSSRV